jgi:soluble lytic murein transglycosylase-like protein
MVGHITVAFCRHIFRQISKRRSNVGKLLLQPGNFFMRLILLCTALCVASTSYAISPENPVAANPAVAAANANSTAVPASASIESSPPAADLPAAPLAGSSEHLVDPPKSEQVELQSNENSSFFNPSERERVKLTKVELCSTAASVATANNLPVPFFANLIQQESGFKSHVISRAGAQGIAQFMPEVAASYGLADPFDPVAALQASARLLTDLINQFGNVGLAAAAYNAGPKRVQDWMARRRKLPAETRQYVHNITGRPAEQWVSPASTDKEVAVPPHARCPGVPVAVVADNAAPANQAAEIESSPKRATRVLAARNGGARVNLARASKVHRGMPQPSQFAMGLPVSRFAAMAKPLRAIEKKAASRAERAGRALAHAHGKSLASRFAAMPTPVIMVEEKAATGPQSRRRAEARGKTATRQVKMAGKADTKSTAQRIRVAAAR